MIKKFKLFCESIKNYNFYKNINNIVDGEKIVYYNIPFDVCMSDDFNEELFFRDQDGYGVCLNEKFIYDYIKDEDIKKALNNDLSNIDISRDWSNVKDKNDTCYETSFSNKNKHILRVAKLVKEILENKPINPVCVHFDVMSYNYDIKNHIEDGNHRIRALQYLKYDGFPAYIYGSHAKYLIEYLKNKF